MTHAVCLFVFPSIWRQQAALMWGRGEEGVLLFRRPSPWQRSVEEGLGAGLSESSLGEEAGQDSRWGRGGAGCPSSSMDVRVDAAVMVMNVLSC